MNPTPLSVCSPCSFRFVEIYSATFSATKAGMKGEVWDEQSACSAPLLIFQRSWAHWGGEQFTGSNCHPSLPSLSPLSKKDQGRFVSLEGLVFTAVLAKDSVQSRMQIPVQSPWPAPESSEDERVGLEEGGVRKLKSCSCLNCKCRGYAATSCWWAVTHLMLIQSV